MQFRVGPFSYRVRITDEPITDDVTGDELLGKAVLSSREILIAAKVQAGHRLEVLLHELRHAYGFHFAEPKNEEEGCQFFATITTQAMLDLGAQGGPEALAALERATTATPPPADAPAEVTAAVVEMKPAAVIADEDGRRIVPLTMVHPYESKARAHGGRVACCTCHKLLNAATVVTSPARWDAKAEGLVVTRTLFCAHCEHIATWVEGVDLYAHRPNGGLVSGPVIRKGIEAERFLRDHPEAAGFVGV